MSDVFTNQEVLVAHANARLNLHGRRLLVTRVIEDGRPVSHVANVDAVATWDESTGRCALFLVNRAERTPTTVDIDVARLGVATIAECTTLADEDPFASNTRVQPERVQPHDNTTATLASGVVSLVLPPVSWTALALT